jgi:glycosyltransferase involved in cell wall biosynthesis
MKLVFVLENYFPNIGGVETLFKSLIESLAEENHQITIITSRITKKSPLKEKNGNIQIIRMPFNNRYLFTFIGFFYVLPYAKKSDLIHTTSYNAAIPAFLAGKLFGKKIIITFHEVWADLWFQLPYMNKISKWAHYLFENMLLKLSFNHFVGVSKSTSENLVKAGINPKIISTIYNGIHYNGTVNLANKTSQIDKNKKFTFTYFGRLGISKGLDLLLPAALEMSKKYPNTQLKLIIPKVPFSFLNKVLDFIAKNDLEDYISLKHHLSKKELKRELLISDCVVIPSYSEGFCFAAVETLALGIPLISSDQTALKEVVSGKFIKMKEFSVSGLVEAMEKANAKQWENSPLIKFELKETIKNYKELYTQFVIT